MTVFITNRGLHDYSQAEEYGKLVAITTGRVNVANIKKLEPEIQRVLKDAGPDDILFVSGGHPLVNALAQGYFQRKYGHVNLLYHDSGYEAGSKRYRLVRKMTFDDIHVTEPAGAVTCPECGCVISEAPAGIFAVAVNPCVICASNGELEESA